jgi:hypothetical protein
MAKEAARVLIGMVVIFGVLGFLILLPFQLQLDKLKGEIEVLQHQVGPVAKWPQAINCGSAWDALFVLHGNPIKDDGVLAWYVQVFPNEYRYVRFNLDGSYYDRAGHSQSSVGCANRSIEQLRQEQRTYQFIQK